MCTIDIITQKKLVYCSLFIFLSTSTSQYALCISKAKIKFDLVMQITHVVINVNILEEIFIFNEYYYCSPYLGFLLFSSEQLRCNKLYLMCVVCHTGESLSFFVYIVKTYA